MLTDLLFVHGMWSQSSVWDDWLPRFEAHGFRCRALTLPAHHAGASERELAGVDFEACMAVALHEVAAMQRPVVIGHSLGGLIAQQLAARLDPRAIVLINSAAPRALLPLRPVILPGLARHLHWGAWRNALRLSRWEGDYLLWGGLAPRQRERLFERSVPESGRLVYELAFGPLSPRRAHHVDRDAIRCPMLALAGSEDRIIPRGVSRSMAAYYGSKLSYREFPGRAHWLLAEPGFEERMAEVIRWLEGQAAARAA